MAQGLTEGELKHVGEANSPTSHRTRIPTVNDKSIRTVLLTRGDVRYKLVSRKKV